MKRFCILLLVAIALVACEKENESVVRNTDLQEVVAQNKVSLKEALLYAENSINGINPTTRSAERKVKSTEIYVAKPATRSAEDTEVSFYLINYENNEGFAMVSTDSRTTPVYAYADKGNITANDLETNPFYNIFMDGAVPYYEYEVANYEEPEDIELGDSLDDPRPIFIDNILCYQKTDTIEVSAEAHISTLWHQEYPYNCHLQDTTWVAGCSPVAAAQIMAYHEWPAYCDQYTFDYDVMKSVSRSYSKTPTASQAARLIERFGDKAGTTYSATNSETTHINVRSALVDFGYSCSSVTEYTPYLVRDNIDKDLPVLIFGKRTEDIDSEGHTWIIDDYVYTYKNIKYYYAQSPYNLYKNVISEISTHFRCVTGFGDTVTILSTNFDLKDGYIFNYRRKMIYNIEPNN